MQITKNGGNVVLYDTLSKTRDITKYKIIDKKDAKTGFYLKIISDVLTLRCKSYTQDEFNINKSELYDVNMDIKCHEYQDHMVFEYTANFISDEFLDQSIENEVLELFNDFYENTIYTVDDVKIALSTLKLSYDFLIDNHIAYTRRIAKDTYLKNNDKYSTLEFNLKQIEEFDYDYLNQCFDEIKTVGEFLFYHTDVSKNPKLPKYKFDPLKIASYDGNNEYEEVNIDKQLSQSNLCLYLNSDHDFSKYHMMLFSSILGGGIFSKLFVNVREKHSLCYTINSSYISKNIISVFCALNAENVEKALTLILAEIDQMKNGNIDEFSIAKEKMISDYKRSRNSYQLHKNLIRNNYLKGTIDDIDMIISEFEKVQIEDIIQIATKIKVTKKIVMG